MIFIITVQAQFMQCGLKAYQAMPIVYLIRYYLSGQ